MEGWFQLDLSGPHRFGKCRRSHELEQTIDNPKPYTLNPK